MGCNEPGAADVKVHRLPSHSFATGKARRMTTKVARSATPAEETIAPAFVTTARVEGNASLVAERQIFVAAT